MVPSRPACRAALLPQGWCFCSRAIFLFVLEKFSLVVNRKGKELKVNRKIHTCIRITNHFPVHLKLTQYYKATRLQFQEKKEKGRDLGWGVCVWGG